MLHSKKFQKNRVQVFYILKISEAGFVFLAVHTVTMDFQLLVQLRDQVREFVTFKLTALLSAGSRSSRGVC